MKPINVQLSYGSLVEGATWDKGFLAVQKLGKDGNFSELPRKPAKTLKAAVQMVSQIYPHEIIVA
uniref:Uncharacterized protein n=1 Tax=Myoviridae sp. ctPSW2 TaxID=2826648 RepID=A0A8S5MMV5_9CAUD|nr:MAG TPA: hypothetical protein [Myoviridae sp. ctPSW2]